MSLESPVWEGCKQKIRRAKRQCTSLKSDPVGCVGYKTLTQTIYQQFSYKTIFLSYKQDPFPPIYE